MEVLFICTGNTCRSPMASALFNSLAGEAGPSSCSAGIAAYDGLPASPLALEAVRSEYGIDLSVHRSSRLTSPMVAAAGLLVVMTPEHRDLILELYPEAACKTRILTEFSDANDYKDIGIPDPFGGNLDTYVATLRKMEPYIRSLLAYILSTGFSREV